MRGDSWRRRWRHCCAVCCAFLGNATASLINPVGAQEAEGAFDQGLIEIRVGSLAALTTPVLLNDRGVVLLPLERVIELTGLPPTHTNDPRLRVTPVVGTDRSAELDLDRREIRRRGEQIVLLPNELTIVGGELYLAAPRLAEFLGARVQVDMSALQALLMRHPPFPVEQRAASRQRRAVFAAAPDHHDGEATALVPLLRRTGGLTAEWSLAAYGERPSENASLQLRLGTSIMGGGLTAATAVGAGIQGLDEDLLTSSWQYTFVAPNRPWIRSIQVGNVGTATTGRAIRGVVVSNARAVRTGLFTVATVRPDVPPGWSYEMYQGGRLVGFSDGGALAPSQVPLEYGSNPVEFRFLGPAGEEIRTSYVYQVSGQQQPPGHVEYSIGAGACPPVSACRQLGFASVEAGVSSWLTLSGGAELVDSGQSRLRPVARAIATHWRGWTGQLEVRDAIQSMSVGYLGLRRTSGIVTAGVVAPGAVLPTYLSTQTRRWFVEPMLIMPLRTTGGHLLRIEGRHEASLANTDSSLSTMPRTRAMLGLDLPRMQFGVQYDHDLIVPDGQFTATTLAVLPVSWRAPFRNTPVSFAVGQSRGELRVMRLGAIFGSGQARSISTQLSWTAGPLGGFGLSLMHSAYLGTLRHSLGYSADRRSNGRATLLVGSTLGLDGDGWPVSVDRFGINTASVSGRVFYDMDEDGRFGPGDRPAPDATVHAEAFTDRTGRDGRFRILGLLPWEPVTITTDSLQGIDPRWITVNGGVQMRLTPNVATPVDIPLARTREVVGRVSVDSTLGPSGGITVDLVEQASDRTYSAVTFSDGEFYIARVRTGRYAVRVSPRSLAALGMDAASAPSTVAITPSSPDIVEIPTLRIGRGRVIAEAPPPPPPPPSLPSAARQPAAVAEPKVTISDGEVALDSVGVDADDERRLLDAATTAWEYVRRNYSETTGMVHPVDDWRFATMWDVASALAAYHSARGLQLISDAEYRTRMDRLLRTLDSIRLFQGTVYNTTYATTTGAMVDRRTRPSATGAGWSATDLGRLLIWLKIVATHDAQAAPTVQRLINRLQLERLVSANGYLLGAARAPTGRRNEYQEGRIGYEQYAAEGFALWGVRARKALDFAANGRAVNVLGQDVYADQRGGDMLTSDPFVLMGIEAGWYSAPWREQARAVLDVQRARFRRTGTLTVIGADAMPIEPAYYYYYLVRRNGSDFVVRGTSGEPKASHPRWVSAKAAFAWHVLSPSEYTRKAIAAVQNASSPKRGWSAGVFEADGQPVPGTNLNTAAVVLEAAYYAQRRCPLLAARCDKP